MFKLRDLGIYSGGKTPKKTELSSLMNHEDIPYFKISDMNTAGNEKYLRFTSLFIKSNLKFKIFPSGTIVFPKNGGAVLTDKKRILSNLSAVDLNTGTFTPYQILNHEYAYLIWQKIDFSRYTKGSALPTLDKEKLLNIRFFVPSLISQEKIVNLFNSLDQLLQILVE
ncbi:hypothetical protein BVE84_10205 [Streptococcus azizii]|uniref:Type I restriction modification DNA specificity domain-containing protein n=2 Tax=Streptococcus TaxID=1301 RepID=A0AB36JMN6_9STRE|nr:restriction endonuclease subunit S [Streptococcus azizii]ONK25388.1 hypothetical protein BVE85_10205 [Streptococcus azizii]ONK25476.1 hypothetical protein BVE84_10205 [Streptococcus azizii]ONK25998.1 hypothetical protein BVE86_08645 [Streptococcus azizii]